MSRTSRTLATFAAAAALLATITAPAVATIKCGRESGTGPITTTDAFRTLYIAVHDNFYSPPRIGDLAIHDADGSLEISAVDALLFLRAAVNLPVELRCHLLVGLRIETPQEFYAVEIDLATETGDVTGIVVARDPYTDVLVPQCESLLGELHAFDYEQGADEWNTIDLLRFGAVSIVPQGSPRDVFACLMRHNWKENTFVHRSQAWGFDEEAGVPIDFGSVPATLSRY